LQLYKAINNTVIFEILNGNFWKEDKMPKIISKTLLFAMVIAIAALFAAAEIMAADECRDQCSFGPVKISGNNYTNITIATLPDGGQWPIVVKDDSGVYKCGDPDDYPCLAWAYTCLNDCEKINKQSILISNCCGKPVEILASSHTAFETKECDDDGFFWPNSCSGYQITLNNTSGNIPGQLLFWFTTPMGTGTDMVDMNFSTRQDDLPCNFGIKGPGCSTAIPPVRVEPRRQCYQFTAEQPPDCPNSSVQSTWLAEWSGTEPCAVEVWAAYGDQWDCDNVRRDENIVPPEDLGTIQDNGQILSDYITNNSLCNEGWLRFEEPETGCNKRCYVSGRKKYCF
jgi:hypothetical protein